jgi:hypothetical protein
MNNLTSLLGFLTALSLATERITETIKGLPGLSLWLAVEKASGSTAEEFRKAFIHILAIAIGTLLAWLTKDQLSTAVGLYYSGFWVYLLFGAMASSGSGLWNSALDIVREVNKQKQILTEQLKSKSPPTPS